MNTRSVPIEKERINCLFCNRSESDEWASENGYTAVKCRGCGLVYVNPRPASTLIDEAVKTGVHRDVEHGRDVIGARSPSKVARYKKLLVGLFPDVLKKQRPISWIDVGAGFGELVEGVTALSADGSKVVGLEPMTPKAAVAKARGLDVRESYLSEITETFDFLSLINVFSHIPDFREFLRDVKRVLNANGEILIETGNTADLKSRSEVPGDLDLPDHLVFAGVNHLRGFLEEAGFQVIVVKEARVDGVLRFSKNLVKKLMGRKNITVRIPYTSPYRSVFLRARLR